jgi:hypothetical protein
MSQHELLHRLHQFIPTLGGWCTPERAQDLAMMVLTLRPEQTVVLGVWAGRDTFALALAHQHVGKGKVLAVDPWAAAASVEGQGEADAAWWSNQQMHDAVYREFMSKRSMLGLEGRIDVVRARSDQASVPPEIGFLGVDGNHGPEAVKDVERWAPSVVVGGIVYMDDLNWSGGAVMEGVQRLLAMGFKELYRPSGPLETGAFFQRIK